MNRTAIGVDFGGTTVKSAVIDDGRIVARAAPLQTQDFVGPEALLPAIRATLDLLREAHPAVSAIGAGVPGMIDSINGRVHQLSNVPGWEEVALRALLEEWTGLPATIDNDANAMAYAEWLFGAGRAGVNVVCLTLGTGVGGGLILDRKLYRTRYLIEVCFHELKRFRGIATRYDKTKRSFLALLHIGCICLWLN